MSEKISDTELIKLFNKNKLFDLFNMTVLEVDTISGNIKVEFDIDKKNNVTDIYRYGGNDETYILAKLSQHFDVAIFSEYDEEYYTLLEMEEESNVIKISIDDLKDAKKIYPAKTLN